MPKAHSHFNVRTRFSSELISQIDLAYAEDLFAQLAIRYLLINALLQPSSLVEEGRIL